MGGISSAFYSSQSGLRSVEAWSRQTADNIANAQTEGYTRKSVSMVTRYSGDSSTVVPTGVRREANLALTNQHRRESGMAATHSAIADGLETYGIQLGQPGDATALNGLLTKLQTNLDMLANNPGEAALQREVVAAAQTVAEEVNKAWLAVQDVALQAKETFAAEIEPANRLMEEIAELNHKIAQEPGPTGARAALEDTRDLRLDALSQLMGIQVRFDDRGQAAVHTSAGTELVQGRATNPLSFDANSGIVMAGSVEITPGKDGVRGFTGGSLAGHHALAYEVAPQMSLQLDELARGLVEQFTAADDTAVASGGPGLFTDAQSAFTTRQDLAGRLAVNDAVIPEAGGALWRMRDGMAALTEGPAGDSTRINQLIDALEAPATFNGDAGLGTSHSLIDFAAAVVSDHQVARSQAEARAEDLGTSARLIETARLDGQGVNVDDELQQLMMIEQAYAANSQVLRTLSTMLDTLLSAT